MPEVEIIVSGATARVTGVPDGVVPSWWCEDLEEEKSWDSRDSDKVRVTVRGTDDPAVVEFVHPGTRVTVKDGVETLTKEDMPETRGQLRCTLGPYTRNRAHPLDPAPFRFEIKDGKVSPLSG